MRLGSKEMNSDSGNGLVPKAIADFLQEVSVFEDGKKLAKLNGYVFQLEQEMKKILVFKRELPVCILLLGDAIDRLKKEAVRCKGRKGKAVMMEEFIPSGANSDDDDDDCVGAKQSEDLNEKKNWMSSAQLWTAPVEYDNDFDNLKIQDSSVLYKQSRNEEGGNGKGKRTPLESLDVKNWRGTFVPFKKRCEGASIGEDHFPGDGLSLSPPVAPGRCSDHRSFSPMSQVSLREQLQQQQQMQKQRQQQIQQQQQQQQQQQPKKQRRSWSPELHRRFVHALELIGGPQEATPKQIRELMQVADLTNDEVKSHLQKYRLHVRKMATASSEASLDLNLEGGIGRGSDGFLKLKNAESGSPEGPLHLCGSSKGVSVSLTIGESLEDEEDAKSESHSWKGRSRSR